MTKFHIKENGEPGSCSASIRDCPRGGENEHYDTRDDARRAYEKVQEGSGWAPMKKPMVIEVDIDGTLSSFTPNSEALREAAAEGARRGQVLTGSIDKAYQQAVTDKKAKASSPSAAEAEFEAADREWNIAQATYDDPTGIHYESTESLGNKREKRDQLAKALGKPASSVIVREGLVKQLKFQEDYTAVAKASVPEKEPGPAVTKSELEFSGLRQRLLNSLRRAKENEVAILEAMIPRDNVEYNKRKFETAQIEKEELLEEQRRMPKRTLFNRKEVDAIAADFERRHKNIDDDLVKYKNIWANEARERDL